MCDALAKLCFSRSKPAGDYSSFLSNLPDNLPISVLYLLSEASAQNTLCVAERALIDHKKLELVFILAAPLRFDSHLKQRLSEHRSSYLASLVPLPMLAPQIRHCPLLGLDERDLFARGGDGVHARQIYTSAILAAVRQAFSLSQLNLTSE